MSRSARGSMWFKIVWRAKRMWRKWMYMAKAIIRRLYVRTYIYSSAFISDTLSKPITVVNKFPVSSAFTSIIFHTLGTSAHTHTLTQTHTYTNTHTHTHSASIHVCATTFTSENINAKNFNPSTITTHATQWNVWNAFFEHCWKKNSLTFFSILF